MAVQRAKEALDAMKRARSTLDASRFDRSCVEVSDLVDRALHIATEEKHRLDALDTIE